MTIRQDDHGASGMVAFMIAGFVFVGSVGAVLYTSDKVDGPGVDDGAQAAALERQAGSLVDLLLNSPGFAQNYTDWVQSPEAREALLRLGLLDADPSRQGYLDFDKFNNLRLAPLAAANDGYVNYNESIRAMGYDAAGLDFHVRSFPNLQSVRDLLECNPPTSCRDPNLRIAYIGDVEAVSGGGGNATDGLVVGTPSCVLRADGKAYTISNNVTNGGTTAVQFSGIYNAKLGTGTAFEDRTRSYMVSAGSAVTLSIDVPATSNRSCASGSVDLEVYDSAVRLGPVRTWPISGGATASSFVAKDLWMNPGKAYYNAGQDVIIDVGGSVPTGSEPDITLNLTIKRVDLTTVYANDLVVTKKIRTFTIPASVFNSGAPSDYVATLTYPGFVSVTDPILVLPGTQTSGVFTPSSGPVSYQATAPVAIEVGYLNQLADRFCPYYFNNAGSSPLAPAPNYAERCAFKSAQPQPGDVFPDTRSVMNNNLPERLIDPTKTGYVQQCGGNIVGGPRYDWTKVLVVGSNVDHNSMTSGAAKHAVCEWVMGGGTLIVFGSEDQDVQWLQPIFHSAIQSSSGGIAVPDSSHPILHVSDDLPVSMFKHNGVWSFNGQTAQAQEDPTSQLFTNVVVDGSDPVLTVSDPGAFGSGTVILTTWLPYDLTAADPEPANGLGMALINNLLMQGYRDLFLDYGPTIPNLDHNVIPAARVAQICFPPFAPEWNLVGDCPAAARISLDVIVYVF